MGLFSKLFGSPDESLSEAAPAPDASPPETTGVNAGGEQPAAKQLEQVEAKQPTAKVPPAPTNPAPDLVQNTRAQRGSSATLPEAIQAGGTPKVEGLEKRQRPIPRAEPPPRGAAPTHVIPSSSHTPRSTQRIPKTEPTPRAAPPAAPDAHQTTKFSASEGSVAMENADQDMAKRFERVAIDQARALRDFMLDLSIGPTTARWLAIVQPAAKTLVEAAEPQKGEVHRRLTALERVMARATKAASLRIEGSVRDGLLNEYKHLAQVLPAAFSLDQERNRREPVIVRHLLHQVPGVSEGLVEQITSCGLDSLESLLRCSAADLTARARVDSDLATAIHGHLLEYWKERSEQALPTSEASFAPRLQELIGALSAAHEAFQRAEEHEDRTAKRKARSKRRFLALSVNVLLAQLGEVDMVRELEPLATEQKVQRVKMYLKQSALNDHAPEKEAS